MELPKIGRKNRILLGESKSSSFQRFLARGIDLTIVAIIFFTGGVVWWPLGWVGAMAYASFQDSLGDGQSIGKKIIGLQVIEDQSGLPCSPTHSVMRNIPCLLCLFCYPFPVVGMLSLIFFIPVFTLEVYLLLNLESGVRLGDVMGDTLVIEHFQDEAEAPHHPLNFGD